jgi:hypothetical protein
VIRAAVVAALVAGPAAAQGPAPEAPEVATGTGVVLRALDRVSGEVRDIELAPRGSARFGRVEIDHAECRYPAGNPSGDAYALLRVRDAGDGAVVFTGWMIASAPAISALDHARYDVWVLRCTTG